MGVVRRVVRLAVKAFLLVFLVVFIAIAIHSWLLYKSYIFSQESIAGVTTKAIARAKSGEYKRLNFIIRLKCILQMLFSLQRCAMFLVYILVLPHQLIVSAC